MKQTKVPLVKTKMGYVKHERRDNHREGKEEGVKEKEKERDCGM